MFFVWYSKETVQFDSLLPNHSIYFYYYTIFLIALINCNFCLPSEDNLIQGSTERRWDQIKQDLTWVANLQAATIHSLQYIMYYMYIMCVVGIQHNIRLESVKERISWMIRIQIESILYVIVSIQYNPKLQHKMDMEYFGFQTFLRISWNIIYTPLNRIYTYQYIPHPHMWAMLSLQWHHNEHDGDSNHKHLDCLHICFFRHRSKKTSKWWSLNSPHKGPVTRKMFAFYDIMRSSYFR